MTAAVAARVAALRERRAAQGLTRLEVYVHPADHAQVKALVARLAKRRAALATAKFTGKN